MTWRKCTRAEICKLQMEHDTSVGHLCLTPQTAKPLHFHSVCISHRIFQSFWPLLLKLWPLLSIPSGHDPLLAFPAAPRWRGDRTIPVFRFKSEYKGYDSVHVNPGPEDPHLLTWQHADCLTTCWVNRMFYLLAAGGKTPQHSAETR